MTRTLATGALQISPALTISEGELDELVGGLGSRSTRQRLRPRASTS